MEKKSVFNKWLDDLQQIRVESLKEAVPLDEENVDLMARLIFAGFSPEQAYRLAFEEPEIGEIN